jgi:hypothetical protein
MAYRSITPSACIRLIVSMTSFMPTLREFRRKGPKRKLQNGKHEDVEELIRLHWAYGVTGRLRR